MADPHLDHPGEITWFPGRGPAEVLGRCPHAACPHNEIRSIAWGPDFEHYSLDQCDVPAEAGGCAGTCRSWASEVPTSRGGVRYGWASYLHVQVGPAAEPAPLVPVELGEDFVAAVQARASTLARQLAESTELELDVEQDDVPMLESVYELGTLNAITATLEELSARGWLISVPVDQDPAGG